MPCGPHHAHVQATHSRRSAYLKSSCQAWPQGSSYRVFAVWPMLHHAGLPHVPSILYLSAVV